MYKYIFGLLSLIYSLPCISSVNDCSADIRSYKILKNSLFPFYAGKNKSCFFAFYTINPDPGTDARGNGNTGNTLWYAYYNLKNPSKIYEFPKPSDTLWSSVCSLEAVSFQAIYGDGKRNVTVIGSCNRQNAINHRFPLVFKWIDDRYELDERLYLILHGVIGLTVEDIRRFIKMPDVYYNILQHRYDPD